MSDNWIICDAPFTSRTKLSPSVRICLGIKGKTCSSFSHIASWNAHATWDFCMSNVFHPKLVLNVRWDGIGDQ